MYYCIRVERDTGQRVINWVRGPDEEKALPAGKLLLLRTRRQERELRGEKSC